MTWGVAWAAFDVLIAASWMYVLLDYRFDWPGAFSGASWFYVLVVLSLGSDALRYRWGRLQTERRERR